MIHPTTCKQRNTNFLFGIPSTQRKERKEKKLCRFKRQCDCIWSPTQIYTSARVQMSQLEQKILILQHTDRGERSETGGKKQREVRSLLRTNTLCPEENINIWTKVLETFQWDFSCGPSNRQMKFVVRMAKKKRCGAMFSHKVCHQSIPPADHRAATKLPKSYPSGNLQD